MNFVNFTASHNDADRRLDKIIRRLLDNIPLSVVYKYLRKGLIKLNGQRAEPDMRVRVHDVIEVAEFLLPAEKKSEKTEQNNDGKNTFSATSTGNPDITGKKNGTQHIGYFSAKLPFSDIFKNRDIRIINKPYDYTVQDGGKSSLQPLSRIIADCYYAEYGYQYISFRPGPLHRLDRKTTGLLAFSQSLAGARWFSAAMQHNLIKKEYLSLVEGIMQSEQIWDEPIQRKTHTAGKNFHLSEISGTGKPAWTQAIPVCSGTYHGRTITLVRFRIDTGRTHQIRLHSSNHGFPLLGDTAYGGTAIQEQQNLYLHAFRMVFPEDNPLKIPEKLTAPLPENFQNILQKHLPEITAPAYNIICL